MQQQKIHELIAAQRRLFDSGATLPPHARRQVLDSLRQWISSHQDDIAAALRTDLNKGAGEAYLTEIGLVLEELSFHLRHLHRWSQPRRQRTPLSLFAAVSEIRPEPYGVALVMSPWNYPFQLGLMPLIGAISAGNTVILKPSAYAPATSALLASMVSDCCDPGWAAVVEGGREENSALLEERFDYIFFTGSVAVGRLVMSKAARWLTPVSLELGGKSPVIVDSTADLALTARRLLGGKCINAGQTCVAPDYVLVQDSVREQLLRELDKATRRFYPQGALADPDYPRIVNDKHFQRLLSLLRSGDVRSGGRYDEQQRRIEPTLLTNVSWDSAVMQEEIFGPLLPILSYGELDEAITAVAARPHPLALYLFTANAEVERRVLEQLRFGGGCVNDTLLHLATPHLPFGGVGDSGLGSYHGKGSFDTFTHYKSVLHKATWVDLDMRYPPFTQRKLRLIRRFLK